MLQKLAIPGSEKEIDETLNYSEPLHKKTKTIDLLKNLESISERYNETLKRLAE